MAKKMRKRKLADKVANRKKKGLRQATERTEKPKNPFELKFNRQKQSILGKKQAKSAAVGIPGASRKRALEQRKKTLLTEYQRFGKNNKVVDKRAGEMNPNLTPEEKVAQRFALERQRRFRGKNDIFHLEGGETLTHYGQSLAEIEARDRPLVREMDEDLAGIDAEFVASAHFGGGEGEDNKKSRKEIMNELIAKSKLARFEKATQREQMRTKTEELDETWKELLGLQDLKTLLDPKANKTESAPEKTSMDASYDQLVHQLVFEKHRVKATDRLKTPEELAKQEKQRLERLEAERLRRMQKPDSLSPDEDPSNGGGRGKTVTFEMAYSDGKLLNAQENSDSDSEDDEDVELGFDPDAGDDEGRQQSGAPQSDIPFVFTMPESYERFVELLEKFGTEARLTVLERIVKCHHPSLDKDNKKRLERLFLMVLRLVDYESRAGASSANQLDVLSRVLFSLTQLVPNFAARAIRKLLDRHQKVLAKNRRQYPGQNFLALLTLIPSLFPASDFWHPVVTPALMLATEVLGKAHNRSPAEVAKGLFICASLASGYLSASKRFAPEVCGFLQGVLHISVADNLDERSSTGTFPLSKPHRWMLYVESAVEDVGKFSMNDIFALEEPEGGFGDEFKVFCIQTCLLVIQKLISLYSELPSFPEIFRPFLRQISKLPLQYFPQNVLDLIEDIKGKVEEGCKPKVPLSGPQTAKTTEFTFLEPRMEEDFNPERSKKHKGGNKGPKAEKQRLVKKYKKEMRGALRELRKDNQFLARERLKEQMEKDSARRLKTKRIMQGLMGQEADFKKYERMKEKGK